MEWLKVGFKSYFFFIFFFQNFFLQYKIPLIPPRALSAYHIIWMVGQLVNEYEIE